MGPTSLLQPIEKEHVWEGRRRYYRIGGKVRPGVTTVLDVVKDDRWLKRWEERLGKDEAERQRVRAARRGTRLHARIENWLLSGSEQPTLFDEAEEERYGLVGEVEMLWRSAAPVLNRIKNPLLVEGNVWWEDPQARPEFGTGFAGCIDCVAELDGRLLILDWKTSDRTRKPLNWMHAYVAQAAGYTTAFNQRYAEPLGLKVEGAAICLFNTKGQPPQVEILDLNTLDVNRHAFLCAVKRFHRTFQP